MGRGRVRHRRRDIHQVADAALDPLFAFGKLYRAREVRLHVCELEVWCIAQVYEWDGMEVEYGEATTSYTRPPDYVTLQSNLLFERKQAMKEVLHRYREGVPYAGEIPQSPSASQPTCARARRARRISPVTTTPR